METFEVYRDEKVTVWNRYLVAVKAPSFDKAVQLVSGTDTKYSWDTQEGIDVLSSKVLELTEQLVDPGKGDLNATIEILDAETQVVVWNNALPE